MDRREMYKRTGKPVLKQQLQNQMAQQRRNNRAASVNASRNISDQTLPGECVPLVPLKTPSLKSKNVENAKDVRKKKDLKECLHEWREKKERIAAERQKARKPQFVVSRNIQSKPAQASLIPSKTSAAYKNVAPKVVTRRQHTEAPFNFSLHQLPGTFKLKGNIQTASSKNIEPFVFAAPINVKTLSSSPDAPSSVEAGLSVSVNSEATWAPAKQLVIKSPETPVVVAQEKLQEPTAKRAKTVEKKTVKTSIAEGKKSPRLQNKLQVAADFNSGSPSKTAERKKSSDHQNKLAVVGDVDSGSLGTDYFREILDNEINSLEQNCCEWDSEMAKKEMPETVEENVLLAVGMARLLVREKFNQFRGLIDNCDFPDNPKARTLLTDLQGFWDMIKIQSVNIHRQFEALNKLKQNEWKEEEPVIKQKITNRKMVAPKTTKPAVASKFKDFLAKKKAVAPTPGQVGNTPKKRKSSAKTPLSNSKLTKYESPNMNAMISVSKIAKSVERKSEDPLNSSLAGTVIAAAEFSPLKLVPSKDTPQKDLRSSTPTLSILKNPETSTANFKGSKCVLFDIIPEEDDVDLAIPPVKHTYAQNLYEFSPPKDKFDELFDEKPQDAMIPLLAPTVEIPEIVEVVKSSKIKSMETSHLTPQRPVRRSSRLRPTTPDSGLTHLDGSFQMLTPALAKETTVIKKMSSRKRSAKDASLLDACANGSNDSFVTKRRSSRKRTMNSEEMTCDLMNFDSPAVKVTASSRPKKMSLAKKTLMD